MTYLTNLLSTWAEDLPTTLFYDDEYDEEEGENSMAKSKEFESFHVSKADNGFVVHVGDRSSYMVPENTFVFKTPAEVSNFIKEQVSKL